MHRSDFDEKMFKKSLQPSKEESCCLPTCDNSGYIVKGGFIVMYHRFPSDSILREMWFDKIGRLDTFDIVRSRICSEHFIDQDFDYDYNGEVRFHGQYAERRLKKVAVPRLNLFKIKEEPSDELDNFIINVDDTSAGTSEFSTILEETNVLSSQIQVPETVFRVPAQQREGPSSLPATQSWPGQFGFNVTFGHQENTSKGVAWTYSPIKDKLYVGKDSSCPINFSTTCNMPKGTIIRAMALFSMSEHVSDIVHRCFNHSHEESNRGLPEAEHLIRCECDVAAYEVDPHTRRHSVVVPYENPPIGQFFSTYIYKFACFGSCAGGPNRRPLMVIFTLEKGKEVIGRKKLDIKICACPGRDRKIDEQAVQNTHHSNNSETASLKRKEPSEYSNLLDTFDFIKSVSFPPAKKTKVEPNKDGYYTITVADRQCYEFLKQMKKFYEMCKTLRAISPELKKALIQLYMKKNEESD